MLLNRKKLTLLTMILSTILAALLLVVFVIYLDIIPVFKKESPVKEHITIESGTESITVDIFVKNTESDVTIVSDLSLIDLSKVGTHEILFSDSEGNYKSILYIVDTQAPTATAISKQIYNDEVLVADDFVTDICDQSEVTVSFKIQPVFTEIGTQPVYISLMDVFGNTNELVAELTVIKDETAPIFGALEDLTVKVGGTVSYKSSVTVVDDRDESVSFTVDSSAVDLNKVGTYQVIYTATDKSGNTTVLRRNVIVTEKDVINRALVDSMAREVLNKIITDEMTEHQKIDTIFKWVRKNMTYVSSPEKDIPNAAYVAFTKKRGDCYNYYSLTTVLLDGCGIQNIKVERHGGNSNHFWLLVNIGSGWYHFDTTPQHRLYPFTCFMKTDAEVWAYAKSRGDGRSDYYNFDESLYPDRATTPYNP